MTLIACISPDSHPVLLGDALLSSALPNAGPFVPMLGMQQRDRSGAGLYPVALGGKVLVLHDRIIAAYAGNQAAAKRMLKGIADYFRDKPPSLAWVINFLNAEHSRDLNSDPPTNLLISVLESSGEIKTWANDYREIYAPGFGRMLANGSGCERLGYFTQSLPSLSATGNAMEQSVWKALFLQGTLLADEVWTGAPIVNGFGGLYDIATFVSGRAKLIDDYLTVFWFGQEGPDGVAMPIKLIHRYTSEQVAAFHCVELEWSASKPTVKAEHVMLLDDLLDRYPIGTSRAVPKLNAPLQIHILVMKNTGDGTTLGMSLSRRVDPTKHPLIIEEHGKTLKVSFNLKQISTMFNR